MNTETIQRALEKARAAQEKQRAMNGSDLETITALSELADQVETQLEAPAEPAEPDAQTIRDVIEWSMHFWSDYYSPMRPEEFTPEGYIGYYDEWLSARVRDVQRHLAHLHVTRARYEELTEQQQVERDGVDA